MSWLKNKYHIDDLVINILLQNLEYKKSNQILFHVVYKELGYDGRIKCNELLDVLVETEFIKRTDNKNAELTLSGLNVKNMGGWLKYQDHLTKNRKNKIFTSRLKNAGVFFGILLVIWNIVKSCKPHTTTKINLPTNEIKESKSNNTIQKDIVSDDTLFLNKKNDTL